MKLWPHQVRGDQLTQRALERCNRVLVCSPTGSGKTVLATKIASDYVNAGRRVMFMAPRIELISQTAQKLDEWLPCGYSLLTARSRDDGRQNLYNQVQLASVDTLVSRAIKRDRLVLPPTDLVLMDEAHLYITATRLRLFDLFGPDTKIVGYSATPGRLDGRGLGMAFEELVEVATVQELIDGGYLVKPLYYAPSRPDFEKIRVARGEYVSEDVEREMLPILGDVIEHWMRLANGRRTVVFAPSIGHSIHVANLFREAGVSAEHCDAKTPEDERDRIFGRFRDGETEVLCNVDLATYGFDLPELSCVVDLSPTKSIVKYRQRGGRGMRTFPGKTDFLYIDHAGNVHEHGYLEDDVHWTLEGLKRPPAPTKAEKRKKRKEGPKQLTCPQCTRIFSGALTCPSCGYFFEGLAREFQVIDGQLVAFTTDDVDNVFMRARFFCELLHIRDERGYKHGWEIHTYRERFGKAPNPRWIREFQPAPPSPETLRYVRYTLIKRAKGIEAAKKRRAQQQ